MFGCNAREKFDAGSNPVSRNLLLACVLLAAHKNWGFTTEWRKVIRYSESRIRDFRFRGSRLEFWGFATASAWFGARGIFVWGRIAFRRSMLIFRLCQQDSSALTSFSESGIGAVWLLKSVMAW